VQAIAQKLNYKVDKNASNLRCQRSSTLALLFFEDPTPDDSQINPFFHSMLGSITRACARSGYDLLISFQQQSGNWHEDFEDTHKADGLILLGYGDYLKYRERLERLVEQGTHFVLWGAVQTGQPGLSVGSDNYQGSYDATRHLLNLGRRKLAFLGTASSQYPEFFARYRGYTRALQDAGIVVHRRLQVDAITTERCGYMAAGELLNRGQPFEFKLGKGQVIPGWDAGVLGMKVGGRRKLTIPSAMAYGARGAGGAIKPHEPLVFVVDLLSVD